MRFKAAFGQNSPKLIPLGMADSVAPDFSRGIMAQERAVSSVGTADWYHLPKKCLSVVPTKLANN